MKCLSRKYTPGCDVRRYLDERGIGGLAVDFSPRTWFNAAALGQPCDPVREVPMRGRLVRIALLALLVGCAPKPFWTKVGFSGEEFRRDEAQCAQESKKRDPVPVQGSSLMVPRVDQTMLGQCLRARGYQQISREELQEGVPRRLPAVSTTARVPAPPTGLSGTFAGAIAGSQDRQPFSMQMTLTLVQTGEQITGVWTTTGGTSGTMTARVTVYNTLIDVRAKQTKPCEGEFLGTAVIEDNWRQLRGTYTGGGCGGPVSASFHVTRQQ